MKDLSTLEHFGPSEKLVNILKAKTQHSDPLFFRILVGYYFCKVASIMRCNIVTKDRGHIPVNMYAINLAVSGYGKGLSTNVLEGEVINQFREIFLDSTLPAISEKNIAKRALKKATRQATDPEEELIKVQKEYDNTGAYLFSFDSGTSPAFKQQRHKLLIAEAGSLNMEIDEIGANLLANSDLLATYLETFDQGLIKQKLVKNTSENARSEEIYGKVPSNMMLFGTHTKLLNGGREEDEFMSMLAEGFGRRCFFGYIKSSAKDTKMTAEELYALHTDPASATFLQDLSDQFGNLADMVNYNKKLIVSKENSILLIKYRMNCEERANALPDHDDLRKAEMSHRYFKALKLAGGYAFYDGNFEIAENHIYSAIRLAEESGEAFNQILTRERNYVKLARYMSSVGRSVTLVDLTEDLPFFKGSAAQKQELLTLATAYGYKNNIIIKKTYLEGIEFLSGESLKETALDEMTLSYGTGLAKGYTNEIVPFSELYKLTQATGYHWVAHHLEDNYRREEDVISGFNMIVIDIDAGTSVELAKLLLKNFTYHIYTTKRSTAEANRFRIILPMSHYLRLDKDEYKEFMLNVYSFLPFTSDEQTNQRSRKWESFNGDFFYNDAELFDVLPLIPKTAKAEERKKGLRDVQSLDNLQRWFINSTGNGNRSNQYIKYAYALVDAGLDLESIKDKVLDLNKKLPDKLTETEILSTIILSISKKVIERDLLKGK